MSFRACGRACCHRLAAGHRRVRERCGHGCGTLRPARAAGSGPAQGFRLRLSALCMRRPHKNARQVSPPGVVAIRAGIRVGQRVGQGLAEKWRRVSSGNPGKFREIPGQVQDNARKGREFCPGLCRAWCGAGACPPLYIRPAGRLRPGWGERRRSRACPASSVQRAAYRVSMALA